MLLQIIFTDRKIAYIFLPKFLRDCNEDILSFQEKKFLRTAEWCMVLIPNAISENAKGIKL